MLAKLQSSATTTQYIPIADIVINGGTQSRAELNWDMIAEYAEAYREGVVFPPVQVYYDGFDWWLGDGFHRIHAAQKAGLEEISVDVRQGNRRDAVLYSVGANASHGLRRTNADKRRAVETLLLDEEWSQWSNREIAKRCGVSYQFVNNLRNELSDNGCQMQRTAQRQGKTYTLNTANIGSNQFTEVTTTKDDLSYDDEREWVRIATDRPHLSQWNERIGVVVARTRGSVYVSIDGYTPSFQESEVQLLDGQPLPSLQSSVCGETVQSQPTSVKNELCQKAEELGLPEAGAQVLPSMPCNNPSPADVDERPNVYSPPPPIPVDTNEICTNFIGSIEYLSHEHIVATVSELATRTNLSQLDLMGDEELKLFVNKLNLLAETAMALLTKRHNPS